jgi:predicted  nucleic acid-binding Zn-ribbon protein
MTVLLNSVLTLHEQKTMQRKNSYKYVDKISGTFTTVDDNFRVVSMAIEDLQLQALFQQDIVSNKFRAMSKVTEDLLAQALTQNAELHSLAETIQEISEEVLVLSRSMVEIQKGVSCGESSILNGGKHDTILVSQDETPASGLSRNIELARKSARNIMDKARERRDALRNRLTAWSKEQEGGARAENSQDIIVKSHDEREHNPAKN